jgi:hypothetical protein
MQQLLVIAKDASALCSLRVAQRSSHSLALLFEDCFYSCFLAALVSPISFHSGFAGSALLSRLAFDAPFAVVQPRLFRLLLLLCVVGWLAVCVLLCWQYVCSISVYSNRDSGQQLLSMLV